MNVWEYHVECWKLSCLDFSRRKSSELNQMDFSDYISEIFSREREKKKKN